MGREPQVTRQIGKLLNLRGRDRGLLGLSWASPDRHIVEFLDPACETCAQFFPLVKRWMADNPDRIRLSVRYVAFHGGSDYVVWVLEASRKQDKYWQTLEALLMSQALWAPNHTA